MGYLTTGDNNENVLVLLFSGVKQTWTGSPHPAVGRKLEVNIYG